MSVSEKQLARIKKMEDDFNLVSEVVRSLDEALADYEAIQRRINRLTEYQESAQLTRLMISAFNPPLNLDNTSPDWQEFRKELIELRNKH